MSRTHELAIRVYYEDTDAGGIVYHASYLRFAERARTEALRELGFDHCLLLERHGLILTVARCNVEFRGPARLDDLLKVVTRPVSAGGARLDLLQEVWCGERLLTKLELRLASVGLDLRPRRLPPELRRALGLMET